MAMSSSAAAGSLNELETKIGALERSNFDLKLRLHYLNNKYGGVEFSRSPFKTLVRGGGSEPEVNYGEEMEVLREENDYSKRRIIELESELLQLQLVREKEAEQYQKALSLKPNTALHLEEQRKREREVSLAIAEHDAALIGKLQEELNIVQSQRLTDQRIIEELNQLLRSQQKTYEEKDEQLASQKQSIEELTKTVEQQNIELQRYTQQQQQQQQQQFQSNAIMAAMSSPAGQQPSRFNQQQQQQLNSVSSCSPNRIASPQTITVTSAPGTQQVTFTSLAPAPGPEISSPVNQQQLINTNNNNMNSNMNNNYVNNSNANSNSKEAYSVFVENQVLKDRLELLQQSIQRQEDVINSMQNAATSLGTIESDEILRLEVELKKVKQERDALKAHNTRLENELDRVMQDMFDRRKSSYDPRSSNGLAESLYSSREGGFCRNEYDTQPLQRGGGSNGQGYNGHLDSLTYERTIDLYKQRESELLRALEAVVKRCQELEDTFLRNSPPQSSRSQQQSQQQQSLSRSSSSRRLRPPPEPLYPTSASSSRGHGMSNNGSSSNDYRRSSFSQYAPQSYDRYGGGGGNGSSTVSGNGSSGFGSGGSSSASKGRYRR